MVEPSSVLITGGAGYIGSTLVHLLLDAGYSVRVLDSLRYGGESLLGAWTHPSFNLVSSDIRDRGAVRRALQDIETVVHLAAIVGDPACARQPNEAMEVNLCASQQLLDECRRSGAKRFVFASTCSNYGKPVNPTVHLDEQSELTPVSLYAETKAQFEKTLRESGSSDRLAVTTLRFSSLFGVSRRMRFDLTLNEFALDMIVKKRLLVFGESSWRPYLHVYDAARAVCLVLANPEKVTGQVYNVGTNRQNYRKVDLLEIMRKHLTDAEIDFTTSRQDLRNYCVCFDKIRRDLNFDATRTLEYGARELVRLLQSGVIRQPEAEVYRN
ncbi:MAG TPA: NAD(P)-dependent oxidoreductase [Bryobacteraceae bacterium]|jgi:nucleoside-diphosphate-sugar epimerase